MDLKNIVVATDFSDNSLPALKTAFSLTLDTKAALHLVHVIEIPATAPAVGPAMAPVQAPIERLRRRALQQMEQLIPADWETDIEVETHILAGNPAKEIAEFASEKNADLIVVGTHGRKGLPRVLLGSTAEALLREAPCQVLVVKPKQIEA